MTTKALRRDLAALERDYGEDDGRSPTKALRRDLAALERDYGEDDGEQTED